MFRDVTLRDVMFRDDIMFCVTLSLSKRERLRPADNQTRCAIITPSS